MIPLPEVPTDGTPWNPWKTLPLLENVYVNFHVDLPEGLDGMSANAPDGKIIVALDANLSQKERCWVISHELVHIERGGGCPRIPYSPLWGSQIPKEEAKVNAIACDRLVPPAMLAEDVAKALTLADDPPIDELSDRYWVPEPIVLFALHRLKTVHPHLIPSPLEEN